MAKKYVCDICGQIIDDPYKAKMREYYITYDFDCGMVCPVSIKTTKQRVHLCNTCYKKLAEAAVKEKEASISEKDNREGAQRDLKET